MSSLWDIINVPFGYVIRFCNNLVGNNYLFALLLFAIIIEIILLPFGIKQQKNSIKQAKLRPKEMAIRKKYAGREDQVSKQKMSQEIQEFYQKEGYNPMSGCFPLLIQFPIIIALYNIVMNPLRYICGITNTDIIDNIITVVKNTEAYKDVTFDATRNIDLIGAMKTIGYDAFTAIDGFVEAIPSFDALPNLELFGGAIDLAATPSFTSFGWLLLVPVLTFVSYFFSMKVTRKLTYQPQADDKATGCSNKMMDIMMPLFSVYIAFIVPAAIGVYWIFKSLLGIVKQFIIYRLMPLPKFTEEDYKAAEKAMAVSEKPAKAQKSGKIVRSLHHIDDEDFPDTAEAARIRREKLEAQEKEEAEKKAKTTNTEKSGLMAGVSLKKDDAHKAKKNDKAAKTDAEDNAKEQENTDSSEANEK